MLRLADSTVAEWFSGPANPHHLVFVKMIDLIVHLLGPDLDVIMEELTSQGRRHHRYHSDMIGFFHVDSFAQITDAFVEVLRTTLQEESLKEPNNNNGEDSVFGQLDAVTQSWSDIFTMIRAIMKQGVKIEVKRHKKRAEKQRQEILAKLERQSSESTKSMSDTSSDHDSSSADLLSTSRSRLSPSRGVGRAVSSTLGNMRRCPSASGIRAGLSLLNNTTTGISSSSSSHGKSSSSSGIRAGLSLLSGSGHGKSSRKLQKLSESSSSNKTGLTKGIRSTMSMTRMKGMHRS